jgi:predicted nucleic acid-binding protein
VIILDTNVVSELSRHRPAPAVVAWFDLQVEPLFTTAVTIGELCCGVALLPSGRRRSELADDLGRILTHGFPERILPFDQVAAIEFGRLRAARSVCGTTTRTADTQIAAIAIAHDAVVATRNRRDFEHPGLVVVDPWEG